EDARVFYDALRVALEVGLARFLGRDGDGRRRVVVRPSLQAGEYGAIDVFRVLGATEDHAAPRTAERFVGRGRHDVGDADRRGMHAADDEPGDVGDVRAELRADLVRDFTELVELEHARIRRRSAPDDLGPMLAREPPHLGQIDAVIGGRDAVAEALEILPGDTDVPAVGQMAARRQREPEHGIARLAEREIHGQVCRASAVGLHIHVLGAEQRLYARARELFHLVDDLLAFVVPLAGISLGVLVREDRASGLENGA